MVGGSPDGARFAEAIGGFIGAGAANGRQVRVYGEMVALLWEAGNVTGAIELETLWNGLGAEVPFSLFCSYPAHLMSGTDAADAFARVCHLHTDVVAGASRAVGSEVTRRLPGTRESVRLARSFVAETLRGWGHGHVVDDAVLVVSELATNAVVHVGRDFTVTLSSGTSTVRIAVTDSSHESPQLRDSRSTTPGGHGLHLVRALATSCGHDRVEGGKVVWAELAVPGALALGGTGGLSLETEDSCRVWSSCAVDGVGDVLGGERAVGDAVARRSRARIGIAEIWSAIRCTPTHQGFRRTFRTS